jgi:hypothetical protein
MRRRPHRKGVTVQLPLPDLLNNATTPTSGALEWSALDDEHRAAVVALVARLIAKIIAPHLAPPAAADEETHHA